MSKKNSEKKKQNQTKNEMTMEDYYGKERPRAQEMEQAEGDEDIVDAALREQEKNLEATKGRAA